MKVKSILVITLIYLTLIFIPCCVQATDGRISQEELEESQNYEMPEVGRENAIILMSTRATNVVASWEIGASSSDNITATLKSDGTLSISGNGTMKNLNTIPWETQKGDIKKVFVL